jgi:D-3-phosphoglycerate dehydrogenase
MSLVAITDYTFDDVDVERAILAPLGAKLEAQRCKTREELIALTAEADVVITQFAKVDAQVIGAMRKARAIVRYGIGVDNVDLAAARARGIPVCNIPDYCIDEVADHTLAMVLDCCRRVSQTSAVIKAGDWRLPVGIADMRALRDLTVGVVGFGRIGLEVARRLVAFKPRVLVFDPVAKAADIVAAGCAPASLEHLLRESDLVTLHCPSTAETRRMINAGTLATMKPGSLLVNVGRGDLVDPTALVEALRGGRIAGAAVDVWDPEPIPKDHPLLAMPQVAVTPHVASCSVRAVRALREGAANAAARALRREPMINVVNGVATAAAAAR